MNKHEIPDTNIFCGSNKFTRHLFGYSDALEILLERADETEKSHLKRSLIFPILFLSGHLIEIRLKAIILHWNKFCESQEDQNDCKPVPFDDTHDLCKLLKKAEECYEEYCVKDKEIFFCTAHNYTDEHKRKKNELKKLIEWLNEYYRNSMGPRFPCDKKGNIIYSFNKEDNKEQIKEKNERYDICYSTVKEKVNKIERMLRHRLTNMRIEAG